MANKPPPSALQLRPASGSMAPQNLAPPHTVQSLIATLAAQDQPFVSPQFHASRQAQIMRMRQTQLPSISQLMQRHIAQSAQLKHALPSSYPQQSMPIKSGMAQLQSAILPSLSLYYTGRNMSYTCCPMCKQSLPTARAIPVVDGSSTVQQTASNWQEYAAANGRRFFYNKNTKQSSWQKPLELMTPLERADASTVWKECTGREGRKFYYNKETKKATWRMPKELKLARVKAAAEASSPLASGASLEQQLAAMNLASSTTSTGAEISLSPVPAAPVASNANAPIMMVSEPTVVPAIRTAITSTTGPPLASLPSEVPGISGVPVELSSTRISMQNPSSVVGLSPSTGFSVADGADEKKGIAASGQMNVASVDEKMVDDEPTIPATKQEAKNASKSLSEYAKVESGWTWDQARLVIINDKTFGSLKTLGKRKQAFNEYLTQRKKIEAVEGHLRQRKVKELMSSESEELASPMQGRNAVTMFEENKQLMSVELEVDCGDLFRNNLVDLPKKLSFDRLDLLHDIKSLEEGLEGEIKHTFAIGDKVESALALSEVCRKAAEDMAKVKTQEAEVLRVQLAAERAKVLLLKVELANAHAGVSREAVGSDEAVKGTKFTGEGSREAAESRGVGE